MLETPDPLFDPMNSLRAGSLQELADLLNLILSQTGEGIFVVDAAGGTAFVNEAASQLLGASGACPPGDDWAKFYGFFLPDKVTPYPLAQTPPMRASRGESCKDSEFYIRNDNVRGRWLSATSSPLRTAAGAVCGAVSVLRDITAQKRAADSMRESEQKFRVLFEDNSAGMILSTIEGSISDVNDAFARMLGYQREELRGMRVQQIYADPESRNGILRSLLRDEHISDVEIALRHVSGLPVHVLARLRLLDPAASGIGGNIIGAVVDISGRKRQEQALLESEQRFEAFMQSLPGGAFLKDSERRYVYFNQGAQFWKSFDPLPVLGKTDAELFPAALAEAFERSDRKVLDQGVAVNSIDCETGPGGMQMMVNKFPILDVQGRPYMIGGVMIDVTERQRLEQQLRVSQKMEAVGRLAGGVAHDFNNLLTIISGYSHLLHETLSDGRGSVFDADYAAEIVKATERAAALTGQLLVFSRRQVIQPVVMDLESTIENMAKMLRRTLGENIQIEIEIDAARGPFYVKADTGQMEQLIMNLALNARDAMPVGGNLRIGLTAAERSNGTHVLLEFADSGKGLDDRAREHVFEPYYSMKNPAKFGGLGLSTVYGIVKQNGGEVEVSSAEGAGSSFRIFLPFETAPVELQGESGQKPELRKGNETILLVEDEEGVRSLVGNMLRTQGYRVFEAGHGKDALRVFEQHASEIELLLTDVIMPQMSGRELAERLTVQAPRMKVMYMSGYTDDIVAREGVVFENTVLLHKPFTAEGLSRKLREAFGS